MTAIYKPLLMASLVLTSFLGSVFVYSHWAAKGFPEVGIRNSCLFIGIMTGVHAIGLSLYKQQLRTTSSAVSDTPYRISLFPMAGSTRSAIKAAIWQQIVMLILTALVLDGGNLYRITAIAVVAHWILIAIIVGRRSARPTQTDILAIKYGLVPLAVIAGRLAPWIHRALGIA